MMTAEDVLAVMGRLTDAGVEVWLDGGWAADAALGEQTRDHDDLDLVGRLGDVEAADEALASLGYRLSLDERPIRVVWDAGNGRSVDYHTIEFDEGGGGIQGLPGGATCRYPPEGFSGIGEIASHRLPCLTPELQVHFCHQGYEPGEKDRHDITSLCERLGLALPEAYR